MNRGRVVNDENGKKQREKKKSRDYDMVWG